MSLTTCPQCGLGAHICHVGVPASAKPLVQFDAFNVNRKSDDKLRISYTLRAADGYEIDEAYADGEDRLYLTLRRVDLPLPPDAPWQAIGQTDDGGTLYVAPVGTTPEGEGR